MLVLVDRPLFVVDSDVVLLPIHLNSFLCLFSQLLELLAAVIEDLDRHELQVVAVVVIVLVSGDSNIVSCLSEI